MGNNMPSIWSQKSMIFLTWYFEVCQKLRREVWIVDFWLFSFSFIHVEQTNICKTCSVTQIRGGRMRIGRDGSWQEATTGLSKNLTAALAPNGSSGRKKLGQRRLEMSPLWECYFAVTTIVGLPISWGTQAYCMPKNELSWFCAFFIDWKIKFLSLSQLHFGRTSGSQFARGHELTYSHRTSGQAPAAEPCPCPSASRGPERDESN